ncbi:hypothetical protein JCM11641_002933 [Rhodosporidiobolus odoratus]
MPYEHSNSSPPPAHPAPLPSSSATFPSLASSSSSSSWSSPGSFYLGGSAAPPILNSRRAPPRKGRSSRQTPPSTPLTPPPASPSPPILLTDGRKGKTKEEPPVFEATPITAAQIDKLAQRLKSRVEDTDQQLARRLAGIDVDNTSIEANSEDEPEGLLLAYLVSAFDNLPSLEASFRPAEFAASPSSPPKSPATPQRLETLTTFYELVKARPAALDLLRGQVEAILWRPGVTILESDGGWLITLLEDVQCPVFLADVTPDPQKRRHLLSRFVGILSNLPNRLHHQIVTHLSAPSYPRHLLEQKVELVCSLLSSRIGEAEHPGLASEVLDYRTDWIVRAGARVASLLYNSSNACQPHLPLSNFYVTIADSLGEITLVKDFTSWEERNGAFQLCQYPFLMSLGVRMGLLAWDGERQMMERAREAYRSTLARNELESPLLQLRIRREQLVSDSLRQISENRLNLKKPLRVAFEDEEGIDAGGLRKEWFLLLCRQLFDPQYGMFLHDPDSNLCWFNPASFETEDFYLVGVVLGLAMYNMATLDIPLPLATYKKLLTEPITLADLAQVQPALARGLQQLLDFEDANAVEETFCRCFVGEYEAWGEVVEVELVEGGKEISVTGENRDDYVRLLTSFHLNTSVSAQYNAFAEGFYEVCAGNALMLFKAEELELVVRGSQEPLEVHQLRMVTVYEGFKAGDPTIELFWTVFSSFSPARQRSLLGFITASDRIPATGSSALQLKLQCLGNDCDRLPQSHTCFNTLSLYRYTSREKMERMLIRAMNESEGFGLR